VHFPRKSATRRDDVPVEPDLSDNDIDAVRNILSTIGAFVGRAQGQLQVIALDHAPPSVWSDLPNVVEVEEWRDGRTKLVPLEWLDEATK
jgi:Protein of unknown function (DUF3732)